MREFRLGLLPQPNIFERLRGSLSAAAILPHIDPRALRTREWRAAAVLTLATHVVLVGLLIVLGLRAITSGDDTDTPELSKLVVTGDISAKRPADEPGSAGAGGAAATNPGQSGGGGGKQAPTPASPGALPRMSTVQPIIPPTTKEPLLKPVLPVEQTILGPSSLAPIPSSPIGLPTAPPAPPSDGLGRGGGVGNTGEGSGVGNGDGSGKGPGGPGEGPGGPGGPPGRQDGTSDTTNPGGPGPAGGAAPITRPARLMTRVAARIPQAMLDAGTFGTVRLSVVIGPNGEVRSVTPVQPLPNGGTQAAINALYKCTFRPALKDGVPVVSDPLLVKFEMRAGG